MTKHCRLESLAGHDALCSEARCPFWEPGGAVLEGRCMFELVDLSARPDVVSELLRLRDDLLAAGGAAEESAVRHRFHHLINESGEA